MFRALKCGLVMTVLHVFVVSGVAAEKVRSTPDERESVAITIYNTNLGLVKEVRKLSLPKGVSDLWFEGVAAQIDPTSVHIRSLTAPEGLTILEQNFEYDLIAPDRLMEKYVGKDVELVRVLDGQEQRLNAKLIGTSGGTVYEIDGKIAINPPFGVVLPALPEGLISKPSLVWQLESQKSAHTVEASYLTGGISWRANYVAVLSKDDKKLDLNGWVTIDNHSGATYADATLKLVAGDVNRVRPEAARIRVTADNPMMAAQGFQEESFFEYHLYTLSRKTTVRDNQTKQVSLLDAEGVGVVKTYVYRPNYSYYLQQWAGSETNTKVGVYLEFDNAKKNGLGMPLPRGVVRVHKKDDSGSMQFVGEDRIDHTPEEETVRIKMGNAFDVVAERVQMEFEARSRGRLYRSSYSVTIRNHKSENIVVSVVERLSGDWKLTEHSHEFEKESSHRVRFDIPVPAKGSAELTYTVEVRQ